MRLAEVVACLSLATDLATGQPLEHGLRRALIAVWLGADLGLGNAELSDVFYVALLGTVGCTIEGAAFAEFFQDDIVFAERVATIDPSRPLRVAAFVLSQAGAGDPLQERARKLLAVARAGPTANQVVCRDVALQLGGMLDIGAGITEAVAQCHEHWDGSGGPRHLRGEQLKVAARLFVLAHHVDIFFRLGGIDSAVTVVRERSGKVYEPRIAEQFCAAGHRYLGRLQSEGTWEMLLAAEPEPHRTLATTEMEAVLGTIADFVDLRSPYTLGHSRGVGVLADAAARSLGFSNTETEAVRWAALLHDLGRLGVAAAFWQKREPLTPPESDRMRKHPAVSELVLARSTALGPLGTLAGLHHERLDGSGYRSVPASFQSLAARVLVAADAYQTKSERRPHRRALTPDEAATWIRSQVEQGLLDRDVVDAVLSAPGQAQPTSHGRAAELTDRELEVLRLAVRGMSNREIAEQLVVSPKTVGHHIQHIYDKICVSTRVGATLFALQHGLVEGPARSHL